MGPVQIVRSSEKPKLFWHSEELLGKEEEKNLQVQKFFFPFLKRDKIHHLTSQFVSAAYCHRVKAEIERQCCLTQGIPIHTSLLSPVKIQIWISAADSSFIICLGAHEQLMCILRLWESWCSFSQLTLVENLCRCTSVVVKVALAVVGYVLPFTSAPFPLTKGSATVLGFVFVNQHAANDLVWHGFGGLDRGKWGSLIEQASCRLSPVVDNVLWIEFQTLELNWCVTFCKHKTSRLNI